MRKCFGYIGDNDCSTLDATACLYIFASRKNPVFVKSIEAAIEVSQTYATEKQVHSLSIGLILSNRICPILQACFQVSNVTGTGLDFVFVTN